jgi:hypothetical protein
LSSQRGRVRENAELSSIGYQLAKQLQSFRPQLGLPNGGASKVRAGPVVAGDKALCNRVKSGDKNDRYGRGRGLRCGSYQVAAGYDHGYAPADEIGCDQLKNGGKMVIPAGLPDAQHLMLVDKEGNGRVTMREILPVLFSQLEDTD